MPQTHQNALRDPQNPLDVKTQVHRNVFGRALRGICTYPNKDLGGPIFR
jgi:hypothetical protein